MNRNRRIPYLPRSVRWVLAGIFLCLAFPGPVRSENLPLLFDIASGSAPPFLVLDALHSFYERDFPVSPLRVPISGQLSFDYRVEGQHVRPLGIMVTLNGQTAAKKRLVIDRKRHRFDISLPAVYFLEDNHLGIGLYYPGSNHCIMASEDDIHVRIEAPAFLRLSYAILPPRLTISRLPFPILDKRAGSSRPIAFRFSTPPDPETLKAAGILAAWLGQADRFRDLRFDAAIGDSSRDENAVIFDHVVRGNPPKARLVALADHRFGLVLSGGGGRDYLSLVRTLIHNKAMFPGEEMVLASGSGTVSPVPEEPFSAPYWLKAGQRKRVESLGATSTLQVKGFPPPPLNIGFMLPPALFTWRTPGMKFHYRLVYDQPWQGARTFLRVMVNGRQVFFHNLPSDFGGKERNLVDRGDITIPFYDLGRQNQIQMQIGSSQPVNQVCATPFFGQVRYRLSGTSSLDLGGATNWTRLPDLSLFLHWGYPFTRRPDLSRTTVRLGSFSSDKVLSRYLNLMSRWGQMTGSLPEKMDIQDARASPGENGRHLLFIGTFEQAWRYRGEFPSPPVVWKPGGPVPLEDTLSLALARILEGKWRSKNPEMSLSDNPDLVVADYRIRRQDRTVVLVLFRSDSGVPKPFLSFLEKNRPEKLDAGTSWLWAVRQGEAVEAESRTVFLPLPDGHIGFLTFVRYFAHKFDVGLLLLTVFSMIILSFYINRLLSAATARRMRSEGGRDS